MDDDRNEIINSYLSLNEFNKQFVSISIADAMKSFVYQLNNMELNCIVDHYLNWLWDLKPIEKALVSDYIRKTDVFFNHEEMDEIIDGISYFSYTKSKFRLYLAYMGKESLGYCFEQEKDRYGSINIMNFVEVNQILDDYYYKCTKTLADNHLESILGKISERRFEHSCITLLKSIIASCDHSHGSKANIGKCIELYSSNLDLVLN